MFAAGDLVDVQLENGSGSWVVGQVQEVAVNHIHTLLLLQCAPVLWDLPIWLGVHSPRIDTCVVSLSNHALTRLHCVAQARIAYAVGVE